MNSFINLLREPDLVLFQYADSGVRWEEPDSREEQSARLDYTVRDGAAVITLYPSERPYLRVKLRFRGDLSGAVAVMGGKETAGLGQTQSSVCQKVRSQGVQFKIPGG